VNITSDTSEEFDRIVRQFGGPWDVDEVANEGEYGDGGPDSHCGFLSFCVFDKDGNTLFDSLNSTTGNVEEESDDETGHFRAWDVEAEKNLRLASAAPDLLAVLKLAIGDEMDITGDVGMLLGSQWKRLAVAAIRKATKDAS
jgi:hypothetical protein